MVFSFFLGGGEGFRPISWANKFKTVGPGVVARESLDLPPHRRQGLSPKGNALMEEVSKPKRHRAFVLRIQLFQEHITYHNIKQ